MSKQQSPTPIRMPDELKAWVEERARESLRSVNNEVLFILMKERKKVKDNKNA